MGKPMSWKTKIGLGILAFMFFTFIFVFTPFGQNWMKERIDEAYEATPEADRRTSSEADRYISLAWWRGNILLDDQGAMKMYREFLGIEEDKDKNSVYTNGKLVSSKVSPDGTKGWGPMHPSAPDVYWEYLSHYDKLHSVSKTSNEAWNYYRLFYTWPMQYTKEGKPHPKFKKYWNRIRDLAMKGRFVPGDITDGMASMAPEWKEPVEDAAVPATP